MTLQQMRILFTSLVAQLLIHMEAQGVSPALNECGRSDEQSVINSIGEAGRARVATLLEQDFPALALAISNNGKANGILFSLHREKLAIDIDLYRNGAYLPDTESHEPFGAWWERQNALARWGGRWGDGNHYSLEYGGRK